MNPTPVYLFMHPETLIPSFEDKFSSILIFGPPGSGKGTLGKALSHTGNHCHLSSGDVFRGLCPESPAGKLYHSYASQGHLLPNEVTIEIWHHYVHGLIATNRYFPYQQLLLLDGIPRTMKQAELLETKINVHKVIVLEMHNHQKLIKRIQRRALIEKRSDDLDAAVLETRLSVYEKETAQVLNCYPSSKIARFNADQKPLEVLRDVLIELASTL